MSSTRSAPRRCASCRAAAYWNSWLPKPPCRRTATAMTARLPDPIAKAKIHDVAGKSMMKNRGQPGHHRPDRNASPFFHRRFFVAPAFSSTLPAARQTRMARMVTTPSSSLDMGWKAADFDLEGTDGRRRKLADVRGGKGTLVMFICNHCPYVQA